MIGRTWSEYVFIRLSIFGLRLVAPLSITYLAASWSAGTFLWSPIVGAYALIEAPFFLLVYLPRQRRLQRVRIAHVIVLTVAHDSPRMPNTHPVCPAPNATYFSTSVQAR
jgi:hypothetical protein